MYLHLFFVILVASASGLNTSIWDALIGSFSTFVDGISIVYKPIKSTHGDAYLSIDKLAEKNGYRLETHNVTTADGYILNFHRIPKGKNVTSNGRAVFLMHGIWESSDSWLLQGPGKSLAYLLADEGYDVWMGNARGNRHTLQHETLNSKSSKFWEFSWEEIGLHDLPAMIDYVIEVTKQKKIFYVGFSQGTTSYFVMTSMKPEYNDKIKVMIAMAPEVYIGNAKNILLKMFSPAQSYLQYLLWNFNIYSPSTEFFNSVSPFICNFLPVRCDNILFSIVGPHRVKESLWPVILGHVPTGSSTLQFVHYGQLVNSRRFCRFDYGRAKNIEKYGQARPPDYNLDAVTSPVILFYSGNDWFSDRSDVELLKKKLSKVVASFFIKEFTHIDFMYADEASTLIYPNLINQIKSRS